MAATQATISSSTDSGHGTGDSTLTHDGNTATKYNAPAVEEDYGVTWIRYVLDAERRVNRFKMYVDSGDFPTQWFIEYSVNDVDWFRVDGAYMLDTSTGWHTYDFEATTAKYWRLSSFWTPPAYRLREIEIWYDAAVSEGVGNPFEVTGDHTVVPRWLQGTLPFSTTIIADTVNNNIASYFTTFADGGVAGDYWVTYDLGKAYPIKQWDWYAATGFSQPMKLQYSDNNIDWTDATAAITPGSNAWVNTAVGPTWARYWRIINTGVYTGRPRVYEVDFIVDGDTFAAGAPAVDATVDAVIATKAFTAEGTPDGIFDYLGKIYDTTTWLNPDTIRGLVDTQMSTSSDVSQLSWELFDSTDIGWTSVAQSLASGLFDGEWVCDFGAERGVTIDALTMRGMNDTNWRMKNWKLEGLVDGTLDWVEIVSDDGTVTVNTAGGYATWSSLGGTLVFRYLRMSTTGLGWNNAHERFSAGYFEVWGTYNSVAPLSITGEKWTGTPLITNGKRAVRGILDWLGRAKDTEGWAHPETSRSEVVTSQSTTLTTLDADQAIDQDFDVSTGRSHTTDIANSWWKIDFGSGNLVNLFGIDLMNQDSAVNNMYQMDVHGSNDDSAWDLLGHLSKGDVLAKSSSGRNEMDTVATAYRYIKLTQTAADSNGSDYLVIGEVEFYGLYNAEFGAAGGGALPTVEYGDTLLRALQDAGATSKEVVGALNELNGTTGVEFDLAYRTYIA